MKKALAIVAALATTGCASAPRNIPAAYVPAVQYGSLSCAQIASEAHRLGYLLADQEGLQRTHHVHDWVTMAFGLGISIPVAAVALSGGAGILGSSSAVAGMASSSSSGITSGGAALAAGSLLAGTLIPAIAIQGNGYTASELSRLKGSTRALGRAAVLKDCESKMGGLYDQARLSIK